MSLLEFFSQPLCHRLALTLLHFLWQGLAVAVLASAAVWLLGLRRGNARYAAYLLAFALMTACPPVTWFALHQSAELGGVAVVPMPKAESAGSVPAEAPTPPSAAPGALQAAGHVPVSFMLRDALQMSLPWLLVGWMSGVLILSVRLLLGFIGVYRWRRDPEPPAPGLAQRVARLSERLGLAGFSRVFVSRHALEVVALGYLRPVVLLPAALVTQMSPEMLEAVVAHELAHIRRLDLWVNLAQRTVETLLFYHPAVWWLSSRLRSERELCCDELAVRATGERLTYASALEVAGRTRLAARQPVLALGLGQGRRSTLGRVRHVLGLPPSPPDSRFWLAGVVAVGLLALFAMPAVSVLTAEAKDQAAEQTAGSTASTGGTNQETFKDDPQARALYDQMIEALRRPQSLTYKSDYRWVAQGRELAHCSYTVWLKKPNQFRVEGFAANGRHRATLIGDGQTQWLFWSGDRPIVPTDDRETYEKTRSNVYTKKPAPPGGHSSGYSIGRETNALGVNTPVIDPSTFFGYTDPLQRNVDGVMGIGKEKIGDEECDGIEVSIRKHQLSRYLWLSPKDHLPRKLKQVLRMPSQDMTATEVWSDVVVDGPIAPEKFVWTPPEGWREWQPPKPEDAILKPGTAAPDFELPLVDGKLVKLSDFRDKIVWFYLWQTGRPAYGEEMRYLQKLHEKYSDKGLVPLGFFNFANDKKTTLDFLHENGPTFPTILDPSDAAKKVVYRDYKYMRFGVPLNYIIDRQGKVVDAWYGDEEGHARALAALKKAGLKLDEEK